MELDEGGEGMMETEEESGMATVTPNPGTEAPSAASNSSSANVMEEEEEVEEMSGGGVAGSHDHPVVNAGRLDEVDPLFDPFRFPPSTGTIYERVASGAFDSLDPASFTPTQHTEIVMCLPYLVRVGLNDPSQSVLLQRLHVFPQLNSVLAYMALDMEAVEEPLMNELQRKKKMGSLNPSEGSLVARYGEDLISQFETAGEEVRMRFFLSELYNVIDHVRLSNASKSEGTPKLLPPFQSEIFGDELYAEELGFILPIAMLRLRQTQLRIQDVVEALLCIDLGGRLLRVMIYNMPAFRDEILTTLIKCSGGAKQRVSELLYELASLSSSVAMFIRNTVIQQRVLPDLALQLTLTYIKDEVAFMNAVFNDHKWFGAYFSEQAGRSSLIMQLRARLLAMVVEYDSLLSATSALSPPHRIKLTALLKLYCGLVGLLKVKLEAEEMNAILRLLTRVKDERVAKLGLCWILTCEGLFRHCTKAVVLAALTALLKGGHCLEILSLLAIHFHTNQISSAIQLIRETVGFVASIHSESLNQIATLFTEDLFTEEVVAREAVSLTIHSKLSNDDTKSFAVTCIYHLLKNKIFSKYRIDVGEWVWNQITKADEPIHYLLPALIEEWVQSILAPTTSFCMKRPTEEQIAAVFTAPTAARQKAKEKEKMNIADSYSSTNLTPVEHLTSSERAAQMLALYFALYYNEELQRQGSDDRARTAQRSLTARGGKNSAVKAYSGELMESLPIKALLSYARERASDTYENIYPPLFNLVISQFPGLLTVINILNEEEYKNNTIKEYLHVPLFNFVDANMRPKDDESSSPLALDKPEAPDHDVVKTAFENVLTTPLQTLFILMQLSRLSASELQAYTDLLIYTLLPLLLEDQVQHRIRAQFVELWELLHMLSPFESALKSVNALSTAAADEFSDFPSSSSRKDKRAQYRHMDIVMDPLIIFRCDQRLWRIPPLFKMLLQILDTYLAESHKHISTLVPAEPGTGHADKGARNEELAALLHAQDCAVIQLLLEVCLDKDKSPIRGPMEEVRIQSCTFIHQMFCENPQLMKLVHLQGYPEELLPVTVYGIPSIHIALDFLPELLNQPQVERQIFGIKLSGHLIEKYTLPKCIDLARMVIQKMHATMVSSDEPASFLMETLPSLAKLATTFPAQLTDDTINLLLEASAIGGRGSVGGVAVANPQLHAQIQAAFGALVERAIDPTA